MAVSFVTAAASGASTDTATRSVNLTGLQDGDVGLAFVETWTGLATITALTPSTWTQKGSSGPDGSTFTSGDGATRNFVLWHRFASGELTGGAVTVSLTLNATKYTTLQVIVLRGVKASGDPFDAVATSVAGSFGSVTAMSLTTTDADGALAFTIYNDAGGSHTPPTGFTEPAGVDVDCAVCAYKLGSTPGSQSITGASVSSSSPAGAWAGALLSEPASGVSGALAGTTAAPSGGLTGAHTVGGALVGTTSAPVAALTGTHTASGVLAGVTAAPVGALTAAETETVGGLLAGVTAAPTGALAGDLRLAGALAGVTGAPTGALPATATVAGVLAGVTAAPIGSLATAAQVGSMRPAARVAASMRPATQQLATMRKG